MSDQFRYSHSLVSDLLPDALNRKWTGDAPVPIGQYDDGSNRRVSRAISEGGNWMVMVMDVRRAFKAGYFDADHIVKYLNGEPMEEEVADAES